MKEMLTVRVKGRYLVVPKLVGAFFVVVAALMLVYASLDAVTAWDRVQDVRSCASGIYSDEEKIVDTYQLCVLKGMAAGVYVYPPQRFDGGKSAVPDEELWAVMMPKLAAWLFWVLVLILAVLLYQWGKLVIPVEEQVQEVADVPKPAETEKKPRRRTARKKASTTKK
ncbi:MAG: hypothetical protein PWP76_393 [Candidatus Diapherotrites archaeon]|nr:hypothetical protein [Candidatus Diapherotrites archaeon]